MRRTFFRCEVFPQDSHELASLLKKVTERKESFAKVTQKVNAIQSIDFSYLKILRLQRRYSLMYADYIISFVNIYYNSIRAVNLSSYSRYAMICCQQGKFLLLQQLTNITITASYATKQHQLLAKNSLCFCQLTLAGRRRRPSFILLTGDKLSSNYLIACGTRYCPIGPKQCIVTRDCSVFYRVGVFTVHFCKQITAITTGQIVGTQLYLLIRYV